MVRFDTKDGQVCWVNPAMVQLISSVGETTIIHMTYGLSVTLVGLTADYVSTELRTPARQPSAT